MLLTLMFALALMTIALLTALPRIKQEMMRDRELELQHRGTAYMRAIQRYYKKFGRYPNRIEDLENTNNVRFLRKRYKDPMNRDPATGEERDFKFLHQQDITLNSGIILGQIPGQGGVPGAQGGLTGQGGLQGAAAQGALNQLQGALGAQAGLSQTGASGLQSSSNATTDNADGGDNPNQAGSSSGGSSSAANPNSAPGFSGQTFGGGPILGVASVIKAKSIRVFGDKNHYNDWLFVYIPQADRGGLLVGPVVPNGQSANLNGGAAGQPVPGQGGAPGASPLQGSPLNSSPSSPSPTTN
jgi:type II secretory pathway pseudopilin PulG